MFFSNGIDKRMILLTIIIFAVISMLMSGQFQELVLTLPGVIIAMTFHEYAHAWMATRLGDTTPRAQGRLTLNPLAHLDPMGTILLLFAHVGWGRPVEINPNNFTSNKSKETCELLVALAGPIMNFLLAIVLSIVRYLFLYNVSITWHYFWVITLIIDLAIYVNIGLGVFNLIPIPPLDGSKIFRRFLSYQANEWIDNHMTYIYIIFMVLWISNILTWIISPLIEMIANGILGLVGRVFEFFI